MQFSTQAATIGIFMPCDAGNAQWAFDQVVRNISAASDAQVFCLARARKQTLPDVEAWLAQQKIQAIITLGPSGLDTARRLNTHIPVIAAAAHVEQLTAQAISGVVSQLEPAATVALLKQIAPQLKRIHVIHAHQHSHCEINALRAAASQQGLVLMAHAQTAITRVYVRAYLQLLTRPLTQQDAVWLCETRFKTGEDIVMAQLLKNAWSQKFVLVTTGADGVKKGALLGWMPDYARLGRQLAAMALNHLARRNNIVKVARLEENRPVINLETAMRLGLQAGVAQLNLKYIGITQ